LPFADEDFIKLLSESGCTFIKFGLESGSQRVLDLMTKGTLIDVAAEIIILLRKYKIFVHTYVMFAYPGETLEDNYNCSEFVLFGTAPVSKELDYNFSITNSDAGWHNASYSFTNDEIKTEIENLRNDFDCKYAPANILISTGHTIALSHELRSNQQNRIILREDTKLKLSNVLVFVSNELGVILSRWKRREGIVFLHGDKAELVYKSFDNAFVADVLNEGFTTGDIFNLINEGFVQISNNGAMEVLEYSNRNTIEFTQGNRFNSLKWYGYYDAK